MDAAPGICGDKLTAGDLMKKKRLLEKCGLALVAVTASLCVAKPATAQSAPAQDNRVVQDRDTSRQDLADFDRFLDSHREIGEQVRKDPTLMDNREFVKNHPALQDYLRDHPGVREEFKQNANGSFRQENGVDRREGGRDRDINRAELANFDRFMFDHKEIAEQLRKNPSLMDNEEFVKSHPALQTYLQQNPGIREEVRENPDTFMHAENRYVRGDDDRRELQSLDRFLDSHGEIAEQLRKDPSLVNNGEFMKNHPALQSYLQEHPETSQLLRENPNAFMQEEARYDSREDGMDRDHRGTDLDRDEMHRHFGEFLGTHADLQRELSRDPSQVKNQEFVERHPELKEYLNANPQVRQELIANPDTFIKSSQQFTNNAAKPAPTTPRPKQ
jgi:hypothetical protein